MSAPNASTPRVAFQGERGAFSEEAAVRLLGESVALVPRPTFESLFAAIGEGAADFALAPVENTLAGSVQRSYDLLLESPLHIVAEVVRPIRHCLIGCPGSSLDSVRAVESHPVALAQCERFFAARPQLRRVVADDTAGSVAQVIERGDPAHAAIAGRRAAEIYGGQVLLEGVEDDAENYTRFLLLAPGANEVARRPSGVAHKLSNGADKLSLVLRLRHKPGALHAALEPFARRRIDLLKIESRPVKGEPWEYHFFLDLSASLDEAGTEDALEELRERAASVRLLGCYPSARRAADRRTEDRSKLKRIED
ncbi:MAG: prephenate dehydratase [Acidobacteriota bacterium]|nr:prephenate dehydratase [Acidobacteriota bacterium]